MKKVKIVVISATGSAYKRTIPALKNSDVCEVVSIQGRNKEKLKNICDEFGIKTFYTDEKAILSNEDYNIIYIANPPFLHFGSLENSVKTGKAIICEKPLDNSYENALKIKKLLDGYPQPIMIAHHLRHQKAYDDINKIIASGEIGSVVEVYIQCGFKMNTNVSNAIWKLEPSLGGEGTFSDNGIHVVDFIVGLFGTPTGIFGHCHRISFPKTFDTEIAMLCYDNKTVTLSSSQNTAYPGNSIFIYGTDGSIESCGAIGEKSINSINITTSHGKRTIDYPQVNLYGAEVENFVKHYFFKDKASNKGTTLLEALDSLKIIELVRKASSDKRMYVFD